MMARILRIVVGLIGVAAVLLALRIWVAPAAVGAQLGLIGQGGLGLATLRADFAGFFGAAGVFALAAALRDDRRLLTAPLLMIALALGGRVVTVVAMTRLRSGPWSSRPCCWRCWLWAAGRLADGRLGPDPRPLFGKFVRAGPGRIRFRLQLLE